MERFDKGGHGNDFDAVGADDGKGDAENIVDEVGWRHGRVGEGGDTGAAVGMRLDGVAGAALPKQSEIAPDVFLRRLQGALFGRGNNGIVEIGLTRKSKYWRPCDC